MVQNKQKIVWIDLDNSPHVLFFDPIIEELQNKGLKVLITARDYAQVIQLADLFKLKYLKIGRHYGKNKVFKITGMFIRTMEMIPFILKNKPVLALSHGSRSQILASRLAGIKSAMAYDYEGAHGIPFIKPNYKFLPDVIPDNKVHKNAEKIFKYPGIKEYVYVHKFVPDVEIINKLKLDISKVIVTIRPPASSAHYFSEKSKELFYETIDYLSGFDNVQLVITPRTNDQKSEVLSKWAKYFQSGKFLIPEFAVNGLNLIWHSDLVISGGGTMIREAAALKVPAYSIFGSEIGSVDNYLSKTGRLTLIGSKEDVQYKIKVEKRKGNKEDIQKDKKTLNFIIDSIMGLLDELTKQ
jgi:predicted glycosyltransferase